MDLTHTGCHGHCALACAANFTADSLNSVVYDFVFFADIWTHLNGLQYYPCLCVRRTITTSYLYFYVNFGLNRLKETVIYFTKKKKRKKEKKKKEKKCEKAKAVGFQYMPDNGQSFSLKSFSLKAMAKVLEVKQSGYCL